MQNFVAGPLDTSTSIQFFFCADEATFNRDGISNTTSQSLVPTHLLKHILTTVLRYTFGAMILENSSSATCAGRSLDIRALAPSPRK
jgi:hypothetical protein